MAKKNQIKGYIRGGSYSPSEEFAEMRVEILPQKEVKVEFPTEDFDGGILEKDIAVLEKIGKDIYRLLRTVQLPDPPRRNKNMRWTEKRHQRMKDILGWNFVDDYQ